MNDVINYLHRHVRPTRPIVHLTQQTLCPGVNLLVRDADCSSPFSSKFKNALNLDRLCGLVIRIPGYRSRGPAFDSRALPDFLSSSGSETGSTQPREDN
jgi:hypothetical protein